MKSAVYCGLFLYCLMAVLTSVRGGRHHGHGYGDGDDTTGGFTEWSDWTECSRSCAGGYMHRTRICTRHGGEECEGEAKEIQECNCHPCGCHMAMDFGIVVDCSGSVGRKNFRKVEGALEDLINDFEIAPRKTRVGLITYSTRPTLQFDFTNYTDAGSMIRHINDMNVTMRRTRTDLALAMAAEDLFGEGEGHRYDVPNVLMVITDGRTNPGSKPYPTVLAPLKKLNVTTIAVGVGRRIEFSDLEEIAMYKEENVIRLDSFDDLVARLRGMLGVFCAREQARASVHHK